MRLSEIDWSAAKAASLGGSRIDVAIHRKMHEGLGDLDFAHVLGMGACRDILPRSHPVGILWADRVLSESAAPRNRSSKRRG
jgi:hypothetical protein